MFRLIFVGLFFLILFSPLQTFAGELEDREEIRKMSDNAFREGNFKLLEQLVEKYRSTKERTTSGLWKLDLFYEGIEKSFHASIKGESYWVEMEKRVKYWISQYPDSPTPYIVYSYLTSQYGWKIRGSGYSNAVPEDAWKPFHGKQREALEVLLKNKSVVSVDPKWYANVIALLRYNGVADETIYKVFLEGVEKEPFYYKTYFIAAGMFSPRWGGNKEQIDKIAQLALSKTKSKEGISVYARVYWNAAALYRHINLFKESLVDWEKMKKGFEDMLQHYPSPWNLNTYGFFSCIADDKSTTRDVINRIGDNVILDAWVKDKNYAICKRLAFQE